MREKKSYNIPCIIKRFTLLIAILFLSCLISPLLAQKAVKELREGNKLYDKKDYKTAEINFRKALEKNNNYYKAIFNLGDAMYKQGKYEEAEKIFQNLAESEIPKDVVAKSYHNLGNTQLMQKKYQEGIESYKNALRINSKDMDTKYNLEYAKRMIQQQQQQQQQSQQNQNQKQEQKQDNTQQNKQQQISKQDAERMLNALQNKEKNLREKMDKELLKNQNYKTEKDW
ncbi:MAG: tetratricopeptide repeat protein [Bacteroidales bacterium]|nr:tetratricopeptide repeat protein [Bacteroidales bacterium]